MLPRKRQRPNPAEASSLSVPSMTQSRAASTSVTPSSASATGVPSASSSHSTLPRNFAHRESSSSSTASAHKQVRKARSWYGQWPRTPKASPSTSLARENVAGDTVRSGRSDLSRFEGITAADTDSIRSNTTAPSRLSKIPEGWAKGSSTIPSAERKHSDADSVSKPTLEVPTRQDSAPSQLTELPVLPVTPQRPATSAGWLGWWSRTPFTETQIGSPDTQAMAPANPSKPKQSPPSTPTKQTAPSVPDSTAAPSSAPPSSWFSFWPGISEPTSNDPSETSKTEPTPAQPAVSEDVVMKDAPSEAEQKPQAAPSAGSTWAFWSRDSPKTKGKTNGAEAESGQIAVIGEGSEAHPKPMTEGDVSSSSDKIAKEEAKKKEASSHSKTSWRKNKRLRPPSMDIDTNAPSSAGTSTPNSEQGHAPGPQDSQQSLVSTKTDIPSKSTAEAESSTKLPPNLLLPSFSSTYSMKESPSMVRQIAQFLMRTSQPPANHVYRVKEPPKIRKAIAIGVHGLLPAMYLRPMIGAPTGTSIRFANLGADAIRRWADSHGCPDCEIEKVALEGEGKIAERVDNLWKLMLNWIEHIRKADLIIIACHSQGVPVSIMLVDKLIDLGIITNARIGVCAMAGVSLGPFPDYKSGILMGSAAELWDFGNPESSNSQRFEAALKNALNYGARITFIGSIDDQLVPMESAVYSPANHPYIYRAVFIDGRVHAPDFIAHLVGFALKLRNLGVSDHGLIRELSLALAGSLYSGEGHSRLYYDDAVYDLAVAHALETSTVVQQPSQNDIVGKRESLAATPNPYLLPWIMRGLLEEDVVKTELSRETEELLRQFDDWKPTNKALKDVKYRLEAVRSRL